MELTINKPTKVNVRYILAEIQPRYLEDTTFMIDGNEVEDDSSNPRIAGITTEFDRDEFDCEDYLIRWKIDVNTGQIMDWNGLDAHIHYKVVDQGKYSMLDEDGNKIASGDFGSYVPEMFEVDDNGYGDYIIMHVNKDGFIQNWKCYPDMFDEETFGLQPGNMR